MKRQKILKDNFLSICEYLQISIKLFTIVYIGRDLCAISILCTKNIYTCWSEAPESEGFGWNERGRKGRVFGDDKRGSAHWNPFGGSSPLEAYSEVKLSRCEPPQANLLCTDASLIIFKA